MPLDQSRERLHLILGSFAMLNATVMTTPPNIAIDLIITRDLTESAMPSEIAETEFSPTSDLPSASCIRKSVVTTKKTAVAFCIFASGVSLTAVACFPGRQLRMESAMYELLRNLMNPAWWTVDRILIAAYQVVIFGAILKGTIDEIGGQ